MIGDPPMEQPIPAISTVAKQWKDCSERLIPEVPRESIQYGEMRKAFYAGFGQCLLVVQQEIGHEARPDQEGAEAFQKLLEETLEFWSAEQKRYDTAHRGMPI